jgi:hypothetical protein
MPASLSMAAAPDLVLLVGGTVEGAPQVRRTRNDHSKKLLGTGSKGRVVVVTYPTCKSAAADATVATRPNADVLVSILDTAPTVKAAARVAGSDTTLTTPTVSVGFYTTKDSVQERDAI